jgi:hypothetical protein
MDVEVDHVQEHLASINEAYAKVDEAWSQTVTAIVETGKRLIAAKAALQHGQWLKQLMKAGLPFGARTAQHYMAIAKNPAMSDAKLVSLFPQCLGAVLELSPLEPEKIMDLIEDGYITPTTTRAQAKALRAPSKSEVTKAKAAKAEHAEDEDEATEAIALVEQLYELQSRLNPEEVADSLDGDAARKWRAVSEWCAAVAEAIP